MSGIPEATPIILTEAERAELEGLARSTKMRQRARIVLLASHTPLRSRAGRAPDVWTKARLHQKLIKARFAEQ
jgi:hypothetical protein